MRSGAEGGRCPHCKAEVPKDHGRVCVECGGSLQKRYLSIGCLSSKPIILIALGLPLWMSSGEETAAADSDPPRPASVERVTNDRDPLPPADSRAGIAAPR